MTVDLPPPQIEAALLFADASNPCECEEYKKPEKKAEEKKPKKVLKELDVGDIYERLKEMELELEKCRASKDTLVVFKKVRVYKPKEPEEFEEPEKSEKKPVFVLEESMIGSQSVPLKHLLLKIKGTYRQGSGPKRCSGPQKKEQYGISSGITIYSDRRGKTDPEFFIIPQYAVHSIDFNDNKLECSQASCFPEIDTKQYVNMSYWDFSMSWFPSCDSPFGLGFSYWTGEQRTEDLFSKAADDCSDPCYGRPCYLAYNNIDISGLEFTIHFLVGDERDWFNAEARMGIGNQKLKLEYVNPLEEECKRVEVEDNNFGISFGADIKLVFYNDLTSRSALVFSGYYAKPNTDILDYVTHWFSVGAEFDF